MRCCFSNFFFHDSSGNLPGSEMLNKENISTKNISKANKEF